MLRAVGLPIRASALGAFASSRILAEGPRGALLHMDRVAWFTIAMTALLPVMMVRVERETAPAR